MKTLFIFALLSFLFSCGHYHYSGKHQLKKAVKSDFRSEKNKARDPYRNPKKTLMFFEVKPSMKVAEISPGRGWYTEILGPYLKDEGELTLTIFSDTSERSYAASVNKTIREMIKDKDHFGKVTLKTLETPKYIGPIAPENTLDRVLTFRNIHSWMRDGKLKEVMLEFYKALKPGGMLGVVAHRLPMSRKQDPKAKNGYVREDFVIEMAKSIGFEFVAKSEINANHLDKANHPQGVWTLPPSLRLKDKKQSYYQAIGESDRMTVKFRKPSK